MNLNNTASRSRVAQLGHDVERLRGGFGNGADSVGSSYQEFYMDSYNKTSRISSIVEQTRDLCDSVSSIDPDRLCKSGFSLIGIVKNYPKV